MVSQKIKKQNRNKNKYHRSLKLSRKQKGGNIIEFKADKLPKKKAKYPDAVFGWSTRTFELDDTKQTLTYLKGDQLKDTLHFKTGNWNVQLVQGDGTKIVIKENDKNYLVLRFKNAADAQSKARLILKVLDTVEPESDVNVTEATATERAIENRFGREWRRLKEERESEVRNAIDSDNLESLAHHLKQIYVTHKPPLLDQKLIEKANEKKTVLEAAATERAIEDRFGRDWRKLKEERESEVRNAIDSDNLESLAHHLKQIYVTHKPPLLDQKLIEKANEKKTVLEAATAERAANMKKMINIREAWIRFEDQTAVTRETIWSGLSKEQQSLLISIMKYLNVDITELETELEKLWNNLVKMDATNRWMARSKPLFTQGGNKLKKSRRKGRKSHKKRKSRSRRKRKSRKGRSPHKSRKHRKTRR